MSEKENHGQAEVCHIVAYSWRP